METRFLEYIEKIKTGDYKPAIKICWLYPDETIKSSFTEAMYDISGSINVSYQQGARRSCSLTINNKNNKYPIDYDNIWIGQKFQIWAGIYLNDGTPYYISQGIFYISNPSEAYDPATKTITIQGVDKWAFLDGSLFGYLTGLYSQSFGTNLKDAGIKLLKSNKIDNNLTITDNAIDQIDPKPILFSPFFDGAARSVQQYYVEEGNVIFQKQNGKLYYLTTQESAIAPYRCVELEETLEGYKKIEGTSLEYEDTDVLYTKLEKVFQSPYTIKLEAGKTLGDWYKEVATILSANVYYNNFGYLCYDPLDVTVEDISNANKVIAWNFYQGQKAFLGYSMNNDFTSLYNDIIVLGKIINGHQAKARLQNQDYSSETNIYKIGIKTKPPYQDDMYYTDSLCLDLAKYYARTEMAKNKKTTIKCLPLYHLDVNQLITLTILDKNIINEQFLVDSFSIPLGTGTMSISCNAIKNFSKWTEVSIYD